MNSLALNLLIAAIWLLLSTEPSPAVFAIGFGIGFVFLAVFRSVLGSGDYVRRIVSLLRFVVVFGGEFITATAGVVWAVLTRSRESLQPNFVSYDTSSLRPLEILLLSYCISLTPGSTTVKISEDFQTLILHHLDVDDPEAVRARIDRILKQGILGFTR